MKKTLGILFFWLVDVPLCSLTESRAMAWRPAVNHQLAAAMMRGRLFQTAFAQLAVK